MDPRSWEEAVEAFIRERSAVGVSTSTKVLYAFCLRGPHTTAWRRDNGIKTPRDVDRTRLALLLESIAAKGLSQSSVHLHYRDLHTFLMWCQEVGIKTDPSVFRLNAPPLHQRIPNAFSDEELAKVYAACRSPREVMICVLLLRTGLRLSEICRLRLDDIHWHEQTAYLTVRGGKGDKDRIVPLDTPGYRLSEVVRQYIAAYRKPSKDCAALILCERYAHPARPVTKRAIQQMMRRLSRESGVHVHAHRFRHTFATRSLAAGLDIYTLQMVLGHSTLEMVKRYLHFEPTSLIRAYERRLD